MAERRHGRDEEQDRGTKDEHGIGREDEGAEDRGTKAELGGNDDTEWLKDPKADIVDPVHTEGADLLDTATVPQFQEGGHHILASLAQPRSSCLRV